MRSHLHTLVLDQAEERSQLSDLAYNCIILPLDRKRKPLTQDEQRRLTFAHRLWEATKQMG